MNFFYRSRNWLACVAVLLCLVTGAAPAAAQEPGTAQGFLDRGLERHDKREYAAAVKDFERALELDPKLVEARIRLGRSKADLGDPRGGLQELDRAREAGDKSALQLAERAWVMQILSGPSDQVVALATEATQVDPKSPKAWNTLGLMRLRRGENNDARAAFDKAIELDPKNYRPWLNRSNLKSIAGDFAGAVADADQVIALAPQQPYGYNNRGLALRQMEKFNEAINDFSTAIRLEPRDPAPLSNRGEAYFKLERYAEAEADLKKSLELRPGEEQTSERLFWCYLESRRFVEAAETCTRAIQKPPANEKLVAILLAYRALATSNLDRPNETIADANKSLEILPRNFLAIVARGSAYLASGQLDKAKPDLETAVAMNPKEPNLLGKLMLLRFYEDDLAGAKDAAQRGLAARPHHPEALVVLARLRLIDSQPDEALKYMDEAVQHHPAIGQMRLVRGDVFRQKGQPKEAVAEWEKALSIFSPPPSAHEDILHAITFGRIADARLTLGDRRGALVAADRAVELFPKDANAWNARGLLKMKLDDYRGALTDFDQACQLASNLQEVFWNRAIVQRELGALKSAVEDLTRAATLTSGLAPKAHTLVDLTPSFARDAENPYAVFLGGEQTPRAAKGQGREREPLALMRRADVKRLLGDVAGARADAEEALQIDPKSEGRLVLVDLAIDQGDLAGAEQELQRALAANPQLPRADYAQAHLLYRQRKFDEAAASFRAAAERAGQPNPESCRYMLWLSQCEAGKHAEACRELKAWLATRSANDKATWFHTYASFLAGALTEPALLKAAEERSKRVSPVVLAQAHYFAGLKHKQTGAKGPARRQCEAGLAIARREGYATTQLDTLLKELDVPPKKR